MRSRLLLDEEKILEEELEEVLELFDPAGILRYWQEEDEENQEEDDNDTNDTRNVAKNVIASTSRFHFHELGLDLGEFVLGGGGGGVEEDEDIFPVGSFSHALLKHVKKSNNRLDHKFSSLVLSLTQVVDTMESFGTTYFLPYCLSIPDYHESEEVCGLMMRNILKRLDQVYPF